jgi:hypothetical protein
MYLRFETDLDYQALGACLNPQASPGLLDYDSENEYEWMYLQIPGLPFLLNVSREHGWGDVDDAEEVAIRRGEMPLPIPGPTIVFGWDRESSQPVDELPEWLGQYFAERLGVPISLHAGRVNVDFSIPEAIFVARPKF